MKKIKRSNEARAAIMAGGKEVYDSVRITMGAKGRNTTIRQPSGFVMTTKDGANTAKQVFVDDPFEDIGVKLFIEASNKTADIAGDGTSATVSLLHTISEIAIDKMVNQKVCPVDICDGLNKAAELIKKELTHTKYGKKADKKMLKQVAYTSSNNNEEISNIVSDVIGFVGEHGIISLENSQTSKTHYKRVEGMEFNRGMATYHFVTDPHRGVCELRDPLILITDKPIGKLSQIELAAKIAGEEGRPLVIIAEIIEGEALTTLAYNNEKGKLESLPIAAPEFGDYQKQILGDIAVITGGMYIPSESSFVLEDGLTIDYFGSAKKIISGARTTRIIDGCGEEDAVKERIAELESQLEIAENAIEKDHLKSRIATIKGGIASIFVGAPSEQEMLEKKDRIEDAVYACQSAISEGVVAGGGMAYWRFCRDIIDKHKEEPGFNILYEALADPIKQICANAGWDTKFVTGVDGLDELAIIKNDATYQFIRNLDDIDHSGFNVMTGTWCDSMYEIGILDPIKVVKTAIINAISVATQIILTETAIVRPQIIR